MPSTIFRSKNASAALAGCVALHWTCAAVAAGAHPPPRISAAFPTPAEVRDADRTFDRTRADATDLIAYSPDGRILASAGADRVVRLWDARTGDEGTGRLRDRLEGHDAPIGALAFVDDGRAIATIAEDRELRIFSAGNGRAVFSSTTTGAVRGTEFLAGTAPMFLECYPEGVRLANYRTGAVTRRFTDDKNPMRFATITPDRRTVVAVTRGGGIRVWNFESGSLLRSFDARTGIVALAVSATDIAAASEKGGVQVWPLDGGAPRGFPGNAPIAFDPAGTRLAATSERAVLVWHIPTGSPLASLEGHPADITALAFSPTGAKIASADSDGIIKLWSAPPAPLPAETIDAIRAAASAATGATPRKAHRVLIFWRSDAAFAADGQPAANHAIELLGEKTGGFSTDFTRDLAALDARVLANYDALVLNHTARLALPTSAKKALLEFARSGGGVIGIHSAIDAFKSWPDGAAILGATAASLSPDTTGPQKVRRDDPAHPLTRGWDDTGVALRGPFFEFGPPFARTDRRVLLSLSTLDPGTAGSSSPRSRSDRDQAVAWIKTFGRGRVVYCGLGHDAETFRDPRVLQFLLAGLQYALGDLEADATPLAHRP